MHRQFDRITRSIIERFERALAVLVLDDSPVTDRSARHVLTDVAERHPSVTHDAGAELSLFELILGREKTETTQIYAKTSLKWLLELHGKTHPGARVPKWDTDALAH